MCTRAARAAPIMGGTSSPDEGQPVPEMIRDGLLSWATELDEETVEQAARTARLPIVEGHVALMPDAHLGQGATIGSVIPTRGAVIPAAVGVDIGCGMVAVDTTVDAGDLPGDLRPLLRRIQQRVPAGVGQGHDHERHGQRWINQQHGRTGHTPELVRGRGATKAAQQFGTLGGGNHFGELALDETGHVWTVVHSGSRGTGFQLARQHIDRAKELMREQEVELEDASLAYLTEGTEAFDAYLADLRWAQDYARGNRERMTDLVLQCLAEEVGRDGVQDVEQDRFDCHHNYTAREEHGGRSLWITRKGAIRAREGDRGVIPGSMGTASYIVTGRGNEDSFTSAAHGAGRRMSRTQARRQLDVEEFEQQMEGRAWLSHQAEALLDEAPDAYKDIDQVMAAQSDLVATDHELHAVLNFKGT